MTLSGKDGILNEKLSITLFETHKDSIYRMAYLYMKNQADSLDIVQEVAYRAFKNRKSLKELSYFKTWILKITINASIDLLRKKKKVVELHFTSELGTQQTEEKYSDLLLHELLLGWIRGTETNWGVTASQFRNLRHCIHLKLLFYLN
ncbi:RNA polymerase sigma factor [Neobacillus bataviensis]|uniref:RNA polymerase sigma factor n=1 Tax=Neobacillus bataviensis TaxID=220685 RepID=UPI001CC197B0|nr:RNA polymerase sigma factor [Neobacillus bataviensis]